MTAIMFRFLIVLFLIIHVSCKESKQTTLQDNENALTQELKLVVEGNRFGYMNNEGKLVIPYKYKNALQFSENLAAVRLEGLWGYIDKLGNWAIKPQFDFATPFEGGIATMYIDGKAFFIDNKGVKLFSSEIPFNELQSIPENDNLFIGAYKNGDPRGYNALYGVINKNGKVILDTIYSKIDYTYDDIFVVESVKKGLEKYNLDKFALNEVGVIDTKGNWLIPFYKFDDIVYNKGGYFICEIKSTNKNEPDKCEIKNKNFKTILNISDNTYLSNTEMIYDEYLLLNPYDEQHSLQMINQNGENVFGKNKWKDVSSLIKNRMLALDLEDKCFMIDINGNKLSEEIKYIKSFYLNEFNFIGDKTYLPTIHGIIALDTNGQIQKTNLPKNTAYVSQEGEWLVYFLGNKHSKLRGGINLITQEEIKPQINPIFNGNASKEQMYYRTEQDLTLLYNGQDRVIWKFNWNNKGSNLFNIDYMNRGHFYTGSMLYEEFTPGMKKAWDNYKKGHITKSDFENIANVEIEKYKQLSNQYGFQQKFQNDFTKSSSDVQLFIDVNKKKLWQNHYKAYTLYLANFNKDTLHFDAQDGRIDMILQAKNKQGEWQDIEYLPSSWCGNSYHSLFLLSNRFWTFSVPLYHGDFKTKIRAKVKFFRKDKEYRYYVKNSKKIENEEIQPEFAYSNEVEMFINLGQFWRKEEYTPQGIMDPYLD